MDDDANLLPLVALALTLAFTGAYTLLRSSARTALPLPPGPKPMPLIGHLLHIPKEKQWLHYHALCEQYGDVIYLEALGKKMVVLDTLEAVNDLMDRRSAAYSDRPPAPMVELMGFDWMLSRMRYNDKWRKERRMLHAHVHPNAASAYQGIQLRTAHHFVLDLLRHPSDLAMRIRASVGAAIIETVYGIRVSGMQDPFISVPEKVVQRLDAATIPGTYMINMIPALKYVPAWFPGASFKALATETRDLHARMRDDPIRVVKERMASGAIGLQCIAETMLENASSDDPDAEAFIKDVTGIAYLAGSDTTVATIHGFFLAMVLYPEVQHRAQSEIDAVVGHGRLPTFEDLQQLPYVSAVISESLRWQPVVPMALPHTAVEDGEYRGFLIPKGVTVYGNAWAILHDPSAYSDPMSFQPERFLRSTGPDSVEYNFDVRDPRVACFGFGRRVCPGRYIAEQSLYAMIVTVLATLCVRPAKDENGVPQLPVVDVTPYHLSHPKPFAYHLVPRDDRVQELLRASQAQQ